MNTERRQKNLPDMIISEEIRFVKDLETVCRREDILLFAVPSLYARTTARSVAPFIPDGQIIVDVAKGIEADTLITLSEVIRSE